MDTAQDIQFSKKETGILKNKKIVVIGCGGLGSYVLEMLARFEIGEIVIVDDDKFNTSNLKRQVMSNKESLGKYKVNEAVLWIKQVNPFIYVKGKIERLNKDNAIDILGGVDLVVDCVNNVETKFILQSSCEQLNVPLIHGAAEAWKGQVSTILPKDRTLDKIYADKNMNINKITDFSIIPAAIASYQAAECIKIFFNKGDILRNKVLYIDLLKNQNIIVDL